MSAFAQALAAFRLQQPAEVRAETDALVARVLAPLDELGREFDAAVGRMCADGSLPDRRKHHRPLPLKETAR